MQERDMSEIVSSRSGYSGKEEVSGYSGYSAASGYFKNEKRLQLTIRVHREDADLIQRAADEVQKRISHFIEDAAVHEANRVLYPEIGEVLNKERVVQKELNELNVLERMEVMMTKLIKATIAVWAFSLSFIVGLLFFAPIVPALLSSVVVLVITSIIAKNIGVDKWGRIIKEYRPHQEV